MTDDAKKIRIFLNRYNIFKKCKFTINQQICILEISRIEECYYNGEDILILLTIDKRPLGVLRRQSLSQNMHRRTFFLTRKNQKGKRRLYNAFSAVFPRNIIRMSWNKVGEKNSKIKSGQMNYLLFQNCSVTFNLSLFECTLFNGDLITDFEIILYLQFT
ncbi:hypothetical protein BpHYR1_052528 [Brachionus plicatilis]|uniref:Uncharacterized protein n=1 Tax=Brachionus plicatilis TaxID=10195 RepID=A0A3M7PJB9_BRAPC|nr:hypothetical protein BpHYR1_052528 [Brachionus plicatilis]